MANECKDWKRQLQSIINRHNDRHAVKPKCVSNNTMHARAMFLFAFFRELRKNGVRNFKIPPSNLGGRHVTFMMNRWLERGLAAVTIQDYLSHLRVFSRWIGKPGMVFTPIAYVDDPARVRRVYGATADKSWVAQGVDRAELIARIAGADAYVGAQLLMCAAFGCRVKESIMFRPWTDVADDGDDIEPYARNQRGQEARAADRQRGQARCACQCSRPNPAGFAGVGASWTDTRTEPSAVLLGAQEVRCHPSAAEGYGPWLAA